MKAFYAALVLFTVMMGGACFNYFYIQGLVQDYVATLEPLNIDEAPNEASDAAQGLCLHWEKNKKYVQITATHNEIETITNFIDELRLYADAKNPLEFEKAKGLLVNALEELWLSEDLSLANIL